MPFTVPTTQIKNAVKLLKRVVPARASLPILTYVKFRPGNGTVTGTDLDQTLAVNLGVTAECSDFAIPLAELSDILKNLRSGDVEFDAATEPDSVLVRFMAGDTPMERRLESPALDDWPSMEIDTPMLDSLEANKSFFEKYRLASQVASKDSTRYVLQHVGVDGENLVGGDGRIQVALGHGLTVNHSFLLPITKLLAAKNCITGNARIQTYGKEQAEYCSITTDEIVYTIKLQQGTYPNYRQVIPGIDPEDRVIRIDAESRSQAVATVSQFHIEDKTNKPVTLISGEFGCHLIGEGDNPEIVAVGADIQGPKSAMAVTLNRDYLKYILENGFSEVRLRGATKPITATSEGKKLVFMPIRGGRSVAESIKLIGADIVPTSAVPELEQEKQEPKPMNKEQNQAKPDLSIVNGNSEKPVEPFDELIAFASELTEKTKEVNAMARELPKKVRVLRSQLKQKDKAFAQARQVLDQLQKIA